MKEANADWRDGFLFVGNNLALDYLNTVPVAAGGEKMELLDSWAAVVRWGASAGLIDVRKQRELTRRFSHEPGAHRKLYDLHTFREEVRNAVVAVEGGERVPKEFLDRMNSLLTTHPMYWQVEQQAAGVVRVRRFDWERAEDIYAPLVESLAELLCRDDTNRIRKCQKETCVLHFHDTSKNNTRSWCSMRMCGNRQKVGTYARKRRRARAEE